MTTTRITNRGGGSRIRPYEVYAFAALLALLNAPLLSGSFPAGLSFQLEAVRAGQWWRVLTHPFVHVSWYHLLLDASAFLLLYDQLTEPRRWIRLSWVAACGAGSLALAVAVAPVIRDVGLCGLSGIAHGLMTIVALEMIAAGDRIGWGFLAAVAVKSVWEACTGHVVFEFLHFGLMGVPIAICHLGGVLGGMIAYAAVAIGSRRSSFLAFIPQDIEGATI